MSYLDNTAQEDDLNYLFHSRLNFVGHQDDIVSKCKHLPSQNQESFLEKRLFELEPHFGEVKTDQDISNIYGVFYDLINHCRFDTKNVNQTSNVSREEIKKKRSIKDFENQRVAKIKKTLQLLGYSQNDCDSWREVLNHKNLFRHISKAKIYLKEIVEKNFQLIQQGTAKIKNSQISNVVKIKLCILVMDIITLINTMKFMFNPFNETDALVSKLIQEETNLFNQASEKLNKDGQLNVVNSLTTKIFYNTLKFLMTQTPIEEILLRFWYDLEQIRQRYLVQQNGMMRQKPIESYKKKIDSGIVLNTKIPFQISQIQLEWLNVYNQYYLLLKDPFLQDLSGVFQEQMHFFNYYIDQMIRKQEKPQVIQNYIGDYLALIKNTWLSLDEKSAQKCYIDEIFNINKKYRLPLNFVKNASSIVLDTISQKVQQFTSSRNRVFLKKLKLIVFELSEKLLHLEPREDFIQDYFVRLQKDVITLLRERQVMNKLFQQIYSYQTNIQLNQFFVVIAKIQGLLQTKTFQPTSNNSYKEGSLNEVIETLYKIYQNEWNLIDEIKYFLKTVKALNKVQVDEDQLINAKEHYSEKRFLILSVDKVWNQQKLSQLPYGLLDFIRILIYELIFKIKLKVKSKDLDDDQKFLFQLLKSYYQEKEKTINQIEDKINDTEQTIKNALENEQEEQNLEIEATELMLKKIKSHEFDLSGISIRANRDNDLISSTQNNRSNKFALNFLKKIYQLRLEIIRKNMKELQLKEKPLEEDFIYMKNVIYSTAIKGGNNDILQQEISELASIQYWFIKKRYYKAWRGIKKLKKIQQIKEVLESIWSINRNVLKIHIKIYLKYQQIYFNSKLISNRSDISQSQVTNLVDDILNSQQTIVNSNNLQQSKQFVEELRSSVKILDRIEKVEILRRQIEQRDQEKRSLQEAKTYDLIEEKSQFSVLNGKLKIYKVQKHGSVMMRKYIITCPKQSLKFIENKLNILKKLNLNNINIEIKDLVKIEMIVDQVQNQFDSYPKLVKYLIEAYYRIIMFCRKQMDFNLDPIITKKDLQIIVKNDQHYTLKINPYEGILLNLLLTYENLQKSGIYFYPKHPFVAFSEQIKMKFNEQKIYNLIQSDKKVLTTQEYGFQHLLQQMRSISLENDPKTLLSKDISLVVQQILKCPYFWSYTDKSFELVEFKERYQSMVNVEQCRRKQNERIRETLTEQEEITFNSYSEPAHPLYKKSYGYSKTAQMYFSIEGIMQKQAFLEDIGNFRRYGNYKEFRLHYYHWEKDEHSEEKQKINMLIKMIAKKQRKKGSKNSTYYRKSFPSFHAHIRNLRNLLSHYIYDDVNKIEYSLEYKISLIEKSFPKLFVFIYRWKPYLNKNFQQIQARRVNLLLNLFQDEDKDKVIERLHDIKEFKRYNDIKNHKRNLLNLFEYSFDDRNECKACNIMCMLLKKKRSFWDVLADADDPNAQNKEGKDKQNPPYNYLFYEHKSFACNGMQFLLPYFLNVMRRSSFTTQESAEIKSSINELRLKVEKLNRKIENLQEKGYEEDELFSENSSYTSDEQKLKDKKQTLPVQIRCDAMSSTQKNYLLKEMLQFDYVNKNTIYQLELMFPYLFDDLRRERYQWDMKAKKFD